VGFFAKRRQALAEAVAQAVARALDDRLGELSKNKPVEVADAGAKMLGAMSGFLQGAGELALKGAASALGQRGGKRSQALRKQRVALQRSEPSCELCRDPTSRNISVETINRHREHEFARQTPRTDAGEGQPAEGSENPANQLLGLQAVGFKGPLN
jgi:hypothetical protein